MKNYLRLFGVIALAAIIGFGMMACKNDGDDDGDDGVGKVTYRGQANNITYLISVEPTGSGRATTLREGDSYVVYTSDGKESYGKLVSADGSTIEFETFIVTVEGSGIKGIKGTIKYTDNSSSGDLSSYTFTYNFQHADGMPPANFLKMFDAGGITASVLGISNPNDDCYWYLMDYPDTKTGESCNALVIFFSKSSGDRSSSVKSALGGWRDFDYINIYSSELGTWLTKGNYNQIAWYYCDTQDKDHDGWFYVWYQ